MVNDEAKTRLTNSRPDPYVGRELDGYRIDEIVGRGGMGVVYKATQLSLDRPVAIKLLNEDLDDQPQFLERFHREVDVLSKLAHPNIVTVLERGEVDGRQYLVMEYVAGTSLRAVMNQGPLPPAEALGIVRSVLSALEHAHHAGVVHRDIKPENVLVAPGGIVKVADFGLSRLLGPQPLTRLTHTHLLLGTFEYMAPEQREKAKEADERSDLYATGVVLYESLAGELPIGHFDPLSKKRPECDARIDDVVRKSLEKSPEQRYQRAVDMGDDVSRLLSHVALAGELAPAKPKEKRELKKDWVYWAFLNPVSLACSVIGLYVLVTMGTWGDNLTDQQGLWLGAGASGIFLAMMLRPRIGEAAGWFLVFASAGAGFLAIGGLNDWDTDRGFSYARSYGRSYTYELAHYSGDRLDEDKLNAILLDADVQRWVKARVNAPVQFPDGVRFRYQWHNKRIVLYIPHRYTSFESTARDIAAALGRIVEDRIPGATRLVTSSPQFEDALDKVELPKKGRDK